MTILENMVTAIIIADTTTVTMETAGKTWRSPWNVLAVSLPTALGNAGDRDVSYAFSVRRSG